MNGAASGFGIEHLPIGIFRPVEGGPARAGVAFEDRVVDLQALAERRLLADPAADVRAIFAGETLNAFLAAGYDVWARTRARLQSILADDFDGTLRGVSYDRAAVTMLLPVAARNYVDFYASIDHATRVGSMIRPGAPPLHANYRHLPVGYHGRATSLVPGGTPVVRPWGQRRDGDRPPVYAPTAALDFELELGYVLGAGPNRPISPDEADRFIFGVTLLNDWSARDVQAWEGQPLGPFLSKSFATSISPWITPLAALEPFRVPPPPQDPPVLAYLQARRPWAYDVELAVELVTERMRAANASPATIVRTNARTMYWTIAQQLAHLTSNGASVYAGDVCGSGTLSGPTSESAACMLERTRRGAEPIELPDGERRGFLADGDEVRLVGQARSGALRIELGDVSARVLPAP